MGATATLKSGPQGQQTCGFKVSTALQIDLHGLIGCDDNDVVKGRTLVVVAASTGKHH